MGVRAYAATCVRLLVQHPPIAASRRRGMSPGLAGAPALMLGGRALARFVRGGSGEATTTKTRPSMHASGTLCVQALGMRRPQVVLATLAHGLALVGDGAARMVIDRICARYVRTAVRLKHVLGFPCSTQAALARAFGERERERAERSACSGTSPLNLIGGHTMQMFGRSAQVGPHIAYAAQVNIFHTFPQNPRSMNRNCRQAFPHTIENPFRRNKTLRESRGSAAVEEHVIQ